MRSNGYSANRHMSSYREQLFGQGLYSKTIRMLGNAGLQVRDQLACRQFQQAIADVSIAYLKQLCGFCSMNIGVWCPPYLCASSRSAGNQLIEQQAVVGRGL